VTQSGEIGALERSFNTMMASLEDERRASSARALHAQEAERLRIARGLHDEVGQTMTGVLFQLKQLERTATPAQRETIADAQRAVRSGLDEVRRIAQELRPELLEHLGLASALESLARDFSRRTGIAVETALPGDLPPLEPETEVAVYRIAQEALTNAVRHSGASTIELRLDRTERGLSLLVADDGRGLVGSEIDGAGIRGMRERSLLVGGRLRIGSPSGQGVRVRLDAPLSPSG
jgi:two-component system sensor histidine kinase UhpB